MGKLYSYLCMVLTALFAVAMSSQAQQPILKAESGKTFYAGVSFDPGNHCGGGIVSFDSKDPYSTNPLKPVVKQNDMIAAGVMAEGKYYAMCSNPSNGFPTNFCTIDFKSGKSTVIGSAANIVSMAYDQVTKKMYGIGRSEIGSVLYEINMASGATTELMDMPEHTFMAITSNNNNSLFAVDNQGKYATIILAEKRINERGKLSGGFKPDGRGQSLVFDNGTIYWLAYVREGSSAEASCILAVINNVTLEVTKIGEAGKAFGDGKVQLTGLSLTTTASPVDPVNLCYATVMEDDAVYGGGVVSFDIQDPYNTLKRVYVSGAGEDQYFVRAATMAEGTYYASCVDVYGESTVFSSINLETGLRTVKGDLTNKLFDMTYDAKNKVMYGAENGDEGSIVYSINLTNGALTKVAEFKDLYLLALAIDANGTFYAVSESYELVTLDLKAKTSSVVGPTGIVADRNAAGHSLLFRGNDLYWMLYGIPSKNSYATFITKIDKKTGVATNIKPEGKFHVDNGIKFTGLCFPVAIPAGTPKVITVKTYGSDLGDVPRSQLASIQTHYYDAYNNLVRSSLKGVKGGTEVNEIPVIYTHYNYNDKHQLVETFRRQYGMYDGLDYIFADPKFISTYEYNQDGKMSLYFEGGRKDKTMYEWDGDNLVKETKTSPKSGDTNNYYQLYQITYSDFVDGAVNCPKKVTSVSSSFTVYDFTGEYQYDSRNNKTSYIITSSEGQITNKYEWKYDENGDLTEDFWYQPENGTLVCVLHHIYTREGNDTKVEREGEISYDVETKVYCDETTAPLNLTVTSVSDAANPNTYQVACDVPANMSMAQPAWDVYRDGTKLGRVTGLTNGKIVYTDKKLKNGTYDYFVQTVNAADGMTYNVSNTVTVKVATELGAAQKVRYVSHETVDADNDQKKNLVTIAWDAPVSNFTVKGYNVYVGPWKNPVNEENLLTEKTVVANFGLISNPDNLKQDVVVETVYEIGKKRTEPVTIDLNNIGVSIQENQTDQMIEFSQDELMVKGNYSTLDIYNSNGSLLKSAHNEPTISIAHLPAGVYVIRISHDGKVSTIKAVRR